MPPSGALEKRPAARQGRPDEPGGPCRGSGGCYPRAIRDGRSRVTLGRGKTSGENTASRVFPCDGGDQGRGVFTASRSRSHRKDRAPRSREVLPRRRSGNPPHCYDSSQGSCCARGRCWRGCCSSSRRGSRELSPEARVSTTPLRPGCTGVRGAAAPSPSSARSPRGPSGRAWPETRRERARRPATLRARGASRAVAPRVARSCA